MNTGSGGNPQPPGGPVNNSNSQVILVRLGMLYMQLNEVINNMARTPSAIMKGVLMGTFIISALGLNKPSESLIRGVRRLMNSASKKLTGAKVEGTLETVIEFIIALGEQYGLYYFVQWAVESALCLEDDTCEPDEEDEDSIAFLNLLQAIQKTKIHVCGHELYSHGIIKSNPTFCHLAFNCVPFFVLLLVVILLYLFVTVFGGEENNENDGGLHPIIAPEPEVPPSPTPPTTTIPTPAPSTSTPTSTPTTTQPINTECPTCKKGSVVPFPKPATVICKDCKPGTQTKQPPPNLGQGQVPSSKVSSSTQPSSSSGIGTRDGNSPSFYSDCTLFTNMHIFSNSMPCNSLSNVRDRDILASIIYNRAISSIMTDDKDDVEKDAAGCGSGGGGDNDRDNNDDDDDCCCMTEENLDLVRITAQNSIQQLLNALTDSGMCLRCHDNLSAVGLCSCPNCGHLHHDD